MVDTLFFEQWQIYNSDIRFPIAIAGKQGGKTTIGAWWLLKQMKENQGDDFLIAAPTYKILTQATLRVFFREFPIFRQYYNQQLQIIDTDWGTIFVRSLDDPDAVEGMTLRAAWVDEGDAISERAYLNLLDRVAIKRGKVLLTTNPYGRRWLYQLEKKLIENPDPSFKILRWPSIKNPAFSREEWEEKKKSLSPVEFARRYMGEFAMPEGLVHPIEEKHIKETMAAPSEFQEFIGGIDFGYTDPTAIEILGITWQGDVWIVDEFYKIKVLLPELISIVKRFKEKWNIKFFYADASRPDYIKSLEEAGIGVLPGVKDVLFGIDKINALISQNKFFILKDKAPNLIEESKLYAFSETTKKPIEDFNHTWDAVRYAIATHFFTPKEKPKTAQPQDELWDRIKKSIEDKEKPFDWDITY
jgi:PBSX family phage terminase large subunit